MSLFGRETQGMTEEDGRVLLRTLVWWSLGTSLVTSLVGLIRTGEWKYLPIVVLPMVFQLLTLGALRLWPARRVGAAYLLLVTSFFFLGAFIDHGTSGQAYYGLVLVIQAAALLFGSRGLVVGIPVTVLIGVALAWAETRGLLQTPPTRTPYDGLLAPVGAFILTGAGSLVVHQRLRRALGQAQTQALVTAKANTQLSHEIERRVQMEHELHSSMERALDASRLKSSFLANVSHELRTPMNAVVGLTDLLLTDRITDAQREALETIRGSSDALLALLDDILDLSKIESGGMTFEALPTSVASVAEEVRKLLVARAGIRGIALRCQVDGAVPAHLLLDPTRLRQVLLNLVGNAIKFTAEGEVVVRASWADDRLRLEVCDTGIGISNEQVGRIFQPFVQADASTTRRFGGTGLGLTIVHRLVDAQGGAITVDSVEGKGSCFTVVLPARVATSRTVSSGNLPVLPPAGALASLRVLLAEDNPINEKVALRLMEHLGVKADIAHNGLEAIELASTVTYDVVLMDIQMPELDGIEATKQLRAKLGASLRIVAMTANAMPEDRVRAKEAGCDDFLAKPVRLDDLTRVLTKVSLAVRASAA
ncbi:MAG: ATP-binding protein [Myxococcaceae bacterium]